MTDRIILLPEETGVHKFSVGEREHKTFIVLLSQSSRPITLKVIVELKGKGAEANILGVVIGKQKSEIKLHTVQRHIAPATTSDLLVKGVFFDKSKLEYKGLIEITAAAQNANAFQQENNLVLSEKVDIDTRPELEIKANEVKCTHAATVAPVNPEHLFYLRTRGVAQKQAKAMIIYGFLQEMIAKIPARQFRQLVKSKVAQSLRQPLDL